MGIAFALWRQTVRWTVPRAPVQKDVSHDTIDSFHFRSVYRKRDSESKRTPSHPEKPARTQTMHAISIRLTSPCLHLGCGTLGTLLADLGGLASCTGGGLLRLLGLLRGLGGSLLLLALLDGGGAGGGTGLGSLSAALLDYVERGTDDGTLVLDCAAGTLLGDLLFEVTVVSQGS